MNTLDAINARKSTRGFSERQISDADLEFKKLKADEQRIEVSYVR